MGLVVALISKLAPPPLPLLRELAGDFVVVMVGVESTPPAVASWGLVALEKVSQADPPMP